MASRLKRSVPVTVNDVLDGHVELDLECLDRLYLHGYLGQLLVGGQVIQFLNHRGYPVPSPACLQQIGDAFRRRVASFAQANHIPVVPLKAADRNIEVMRPYLDRAADTGRSQVAVTQEMQRVFIARKRDTDPSKPPQFSFTASNVQAGTVTTGSSRHEHAPPPPPPQPGQRQRPQPVTARTRQRRQGTQFP